MVSHFYTELANNKHELSIVSPKFPSPKFPEIKQRRLVGLRCWSSGNR